MLRFVENLDVLNDARSRRSTPQLKQNTLEMGKVLEMLEDLEDQDVDRRRQDSIRKRRRGCVRTT